MGGGAPGHYGRGAYGAGRVARGAGRTDKGLVVWAQYDMHAVCLGACGSPLSSPHTTDIVRRTSLLGGTLKIRAHKRTAGY